MGTLMIVVLISIAIVAVLYVFMSLVIIKADEKAVIFIFGKATRVVDPGLRFCPWLFSGITRYGMEPMVFNIKVPTAITKNGKVKDYKEDEGEIERAEVDIFLTLITYFSDDDVKLKETAKRVSGDNDFEILDLTIMPFVVDVTRSIFSEMPWVLSYQDRKHVLAYILSRIIPEYEYAPLVPAPDGKYKTYSFDDVNKKKGEDALKMEQYNPLVQFGLDLGRTSIIIDDINFCDPELAKMLSASEIARMKSETDRIKLLREVDQIRQKGGAEADVIIKKGGAEANVITKKGVAEADARKKMVEVIKNNPDLEFLRSLEEMAKGTSNTILYQIPGAFEDRVSKILGGNKPTDFLSLLKDPAVIQTLKDAIKKITNP